MRTSAWLVAVALVGCSGRMVPIDGEDAGGMGMDASPALDGGRDAASPGLDAGPMMMDAGSSCVCPTLPTTCTLPLADDPVFTPDATETAAQLFDVIACADTTLQIAMYQAGWDCIASALQAALDADPDLVVEVVVDDRQCPAATCFVDSLTPADRVTVVRDGRSGLMHHKFVVADGARVWVSSGNWTRRSYCGDHNNAILIEEPPIVARYAEVFDRMFTSGTFGPVAAEGATASGAYTVYFSPESPTASPPAWFDAMVAAIDGATTSIEVMVFAWTRTEISDALVRAAARGVTVRGVVSGTYADDAPAQALLAAGIDVRSSSVHSKTMIIDGTTVVTGSANWSENAWSNNENSLWISSGAIAAEYLAEFETIHAAATPAMLVIVVP